jgi:DNA-directed RNA polymerase subunit D
MKLITKKDNQITFEGEISESLANAIRRYFLQVPVLAVDELEISKNDSPLYDEAISHRVGLVPLKMDKDLKEDAEIELKLSADKQGFVYAEQLVGKAKIIYPKTPITYLDKDQEVEFKAIARIGKGDTHAKFSPGFMFYRNLVEVKVEKDCPSEVVEICPQDVFELDSGKVKVKDASKCDMCEACVDFCRKRKKEESIKLSAAKELLITVESYGQIEPKEIFKEAVAALKKDLKELSRKLSK